MAIFLWHARSVCGSYNLLVKSLCGYWFVIFTEINLCLLLWGYYSQTACSSHWSGKYSKNIPDTVEITHKLLSNESDRSNATDTVGVDFCGCDYYPRHGWRWLYFHMSVCAYACLYAGYLKGLMIFWRGELWITIENSFIWQLSCFTPSVTRKQNCTVQR